MQTKNVWRAPVEIFDTECHKMPSEAFRRHF
ncbi:dihydrofolate reductase, partial [Neisseria meningitidis]